MAAYLQAWVQQSKDLPAELVRCFKLLQELDQRSQRLQQSVNQAATEQIGKARGRAGGGDDSPKAKRAKSGASGSSASAESPLELDEKTEADIAEVMRIADEKVNLAHQIYDFVDKHICSLDKELRNFDGELGQERARLGLPEPQAVLAEPKRRKSRASELDGRRNSQGQGQVPLELATMGGGVTQVDPNEPTYCYCNRVSFGEMIGCDNPDCSIEWFHYECVGIGPDNRPKGTWYCKDCTDLQKAGQLS